MATNNDAVYNIAVAAHAAGLCPVPPLEDGTKRPTGERWKHWQRERPSREQLDAWYLQQGCTGVGYMTGPVSGNLILLEFEAEALYIAFKEVAQAIGLGDLVERIEAGYCSDTPGGGVHLLLLCKEIARNTKLARRPKEPHEQKDDKDKVQVLIETREDGGYVVEAPSNGKVHPTGGAYRQRRGGVQTIVTATPEERRNLYALARTFDQMPEPERDEPRTTPPPGSGTRPGDDFNARANWTDVLEPHGWRIVHRRGDVLFWRRPGKDRGVSATTNHAGSGLFYAFTTSTEFESERGYNKFGAYALLEHSSDYRAAARALGRQGYGKQAGSSTGPNGAPADSESTAPLRDDRPEINAGDRDLERASAKAWSALIAYNKPPMLFRYGRLLVRVEGGEDDAPPIAQELNEPRFRHELARSATFFKETEKLGKISAAPPLDVVRDMLAAPSCPLPSLYGIVQVPVFAPSGALQTDPGYHSASRTYYAPARGFVVPDILKRPSSDNLDKAKGLILDELMGEFPFVGQAERAGALALFLDFFVRPMILGPTPLRLIEAPAPGTGKGLLAEVIARTCVGYGVATLTPAEDDAEWRKSLTTQLAEAPPLVWIDNVTKPLASGVLSEALTSPHWKDRRLGSNENISVPVRCLWLATGNNVTVSTEIARRTARIRLDAKVDQPWRRAGFRHGDLRGWAAEHRAELVWAGLVIIRHWIAEGQPLGTERPLGSFERWTEVLGGILGAAGVDGFLDNAEAFYEAADLEGAIWRQFVLLWAEKHGEAEVGVADLFTLATTVDGFDFGKGSDRAQRIVFGKQLGQQRDRVIGEFRIINTRTVQRAARWRLLSTRPGSNAFGAFYDEAAGAAADEGDDDESDGDKWTQ